MPNRRDIGHGAKINGHVVAKAGHRVFLIFSWAKGLFSDFMATANLEPCSEVLFTCSCLLSEWTLDEFDSSSSQYNWFLSPRIKKLSIPDMVFWKILKSPDWWKPKKQQKPLISTFLAILDITSGRRRERPSHRWILFAIQFQESPDYSPCFPVK